MAQNIINGLELVSKTIKEWVESENTSDGLLSDVESIKRITYSDSPVDEPCVWIVQHPTIPAPDRKNNLSNVKYLQTTFEFVCVVYHHELEKATLDGQNLATRVGATLMKNFMKNNMDSSNERIIQRVEFNTFYPVGEVQIEGKAKKVPATSIVFDCLHRIDWLKCIKGE